MRDGPVAIVRDLDSTNGVFVNGARVRERPSSPATWSGWVSGSGRCDGTTCPSAFSAREPAPMQEPVPTAVWEIAR